MKSKLFYFLPLIIAFASGCLSNKNTTPVPLPSGTFTGQFRRIHISQKTGVRDTQLASLQLVLNTATGFKVTGDTATVHAGSYGGYAIAQGYIQFNDLTYPASGTPTKTHLEGTYLYYYDGSVFQMLYTTTPDTVSLQYDLKKTAN
jgi:hypothetical protein